MSLEGKKIWAVGGGKGGIGKSVVAASLGVALAREGKQVVLMDADLGGANLHTLLGIKYPSCTLADVLQNRRPKLEDIILPTVLPELGFICGAHHVVDIANPNFAQRKKLIRHLTGLPGEYLVLDLGAGVSHNVLDFFSLADEKIVVFSPEPTSVQNVYGFLKNVLYRILSKNFSDNSDVMSIIDKTFKPESNRNGETVSDLVSKVGDINGGSMRPLSELINGFRPRGIVNMIRHEQEKNVMQSMRLVVERFLNVNLENLGFLYSEDAVRRSIRSMKPFLMADPDCRASKTVTSIVRRMIG